uniref:Protein kinase domain-containing protein n=1 Tax=Rhabditophanes sp. KR3021 TaxID=114890 RepID=A0AC35U330_9BILA
MTNLCILFLCLTFNLFYFISSTPSAKTRCAVECFSTCVFAGSAQSSSCGCTIQQLELKNCISVDEEMLSSELVDHHQTKISSEYITAHSIQLKIEPFPSAFVYIFEYSETDTNKIDGTNETTWIFAGASSSPQILFSVSDVCKEYQFRVIIILKSGDPTQFLKVLPTLQIPYQPPRFEVTSELIAIQNPIISEDETLVTVSFAWSLPNGYTAFDVYGYENPQALSLTCLPAKSLIVEDDDSFNPTVDVLHSGGGLMRWTIPIAYLKEGCRVFMEVKLTPRCSKIESSDVSTLIDLDCESFPKLSSKFCDTQTTPYCVDIVDVWGNGSTTNIHWQPLPKLSTLPEFTTYHVIFGTAKSVGSEPYIQWKIEDRQEAVINSSINHMELVTTPNIPYAVQICAVRDVKSDKDGLERSAFVIPFICNICEMKQNYNELRRCLECQKIEQKMPTFPTTCAKDNYCNTPKQSPIHTIKDNKYIIERVVDIPVSTKTIELIKEPSSRISSPVEGTQFIPTVKIESPIKAPKNPTFYNPLKISSNNMNTKETTMITNQTGIITDMTYLMKNKPENDKQFVSKIVESNIPISLTGHNKNINETMKVLSQAEELDKKEVLIEPGNTNQKSIQLNKIPVITSNLDNSPQKNPQVSGYVRTTTARNLLNEDDQQSEEEHITLKVSSVAMTPKSDNSPVMTSTTTDMAPLVSTTTLILSNTLNNNHNNPNHSNISNRVNRLGSIQANHLNSIQSNRDNSMHPNHANSMHPNHDHFNPIVNSNTAESNSIADNISGSNNKVVPTIQTVQNRNSVNIHQGPCKMKSNIICEYGCKSDVACQCPVSNFNPCIRGLMCPPIINTMLYFNQTTKTINVINKDFFQTPQNNLGNATWNHYNKLYIEISERGKNNNKGKRQHIGLDLNYAMKSRMLTTGVPFVVDPAASFDVSKENHYAVSICLYNHTYFPNGPATYYTAQVPLAFATLRDYLDKNQINDAEIFAEPIYRRIVENQRKVELEQLNENSFSWILMALPFVLLFISIVLLSSVIYMCCIKRYRRLGNIVFYNAQNPISSTLRLSAYKPSIDNNNYIEATTLDNPIPRVSYNHYTRRTTTHPEVEERGI